jgi:hypothetical protein
MRELAKRVSATAARNRQSALAGLVVLLFAPIGAAVGADNPLAEYVAMLVRAACVVALLIATVALLRENARRRR